MTKEEILKSIVGEVFAIESPKIASSREDGIFELLKVTVNGDTITSSLVIDITINGSDAIIVYILTNIRIIQFIINTEGKIESTSFLLSEVVGVDRSVTSDGRMEVLVNGLPIGLKYNPKKNEITHFFQQVEQAWIKRSQNGS